MISYNNGDLKILKLLHFWQVNPVIVAATVQ